MLIKTKKPEGLTQAFLILLIFSSICALPNNKKQHGFSS